MSPTPEVKEAILNWLENIKGDKTLEKLIRSAINNLNRPKVFKETGKLIIDWPPSIAEIECLKQIKDLKLTVRWPSGDKTQYHIDESTTVESILFTKVW